MELIYYMINQKMKLKENIIIKLKVILTLKLKN
jgi:hypothetical protein